MKYKHYMDRTLIYIKCNNHSYNTICDKNLIGAFRVHFHGKAITAELSPNEFFRNIFLLMLTESKFHLIVNVYNM